MTLLIGLLWALGGHAQVPQGEAAIKNVVETFFQGFHNRDTALVASTVATGAQLATVGRDAKGKTFYRVEDFQKFIRSLHGLPDSIPFQEKLTSFVIQVDRNLASAWVGYEFWWDGRLSHCGHNAFDFVDFEGQWKIVHLIDTREREGCRD